MLLLAALAAVTVPAAPARVTVRIVRAQAANREAWEKLGRKREIVRYKDGRRVRMRLIEFE